MRLIGIVLVVGRSALEEAEEAGEGVEGVGRHRVRHHPYHG